MKYMNNSLSNEKMIINNIIMLCVFNLWKSNTSCKHSRLEIIQHLPSIVKKNDHPLTDLLIVKQSILLMQFLVCLVIIIR